MSSSLANEPYHETCCAATERAAPPRSPVHFGDSPPKPNALCCVKASAAYSENPGIPG